MNAASQSELPAGSRALAAGRLDRLPQILLVAITTAAALWAGGRWLSPIGDAGFSWSLAYRLGRGELLYRDIYFVYGPLTPYLLALTGRPFGFSSLWYLLASWIPAIVAAWLLLECGRRCLSVLGNVALLTLLLGFSLFAPGAGHLVLPYYAGVVQALAFGLGALLLIPLERPGRVARPFTAGLLAGLAFACKPEIGVAALAGLFFAALAGLPGPVAWMARVAAGFGTVAAAVFLFAISCDSLASLRWNSHLWPLNLAPPPELGGLFRSVAGLSDPQWPLVLRSAAFRTLLLIAELTAVAMLLARERSVRRWRPLAALCAVLAVWFVIEGRDLWHPSNAVCLSMLASFLVAALALLRRSTRDRPLLGALGVFAGLAGSRAAFSGMVSGSYDGPAHFVAMAAWVVLLTLLAPSILTGGGQAQAWARTLITGVLIAVAAPQAWRGIESLRAPSRVPLETRRGRVFLEPREARLFELLGSQLQPGERVLVLPEGSAVDVLFDVRSVSPFLHLLPGWLNVAAERSLIARFDQAPPEAVVLFERPTDEYGIDPFGRGFGGLLAEWCRQNYAVAARSPGGEVLKRRRL
ncbi:MAG TPA: hypothetical protein VMT25_07585 [Thermoanaerobaculia bacterium]|nr:hypothetical protein [Thermoanaerobaculia bacterium]